MQTRAVDTSSEAIERYNMEKDIAMHIKQEFDRLYGTTWHCVVGKKWVPPLHFPSLFPSARLPILLRPVLIRAGGAHDAASARLSRTRRRTSSTFTSDPSPCSFGKHHDPPCRSYPYSTPTPLINHHPSPLCDTTISIGMCITYSSTIRRSD